MGYLRIDTGVYIDMYRDRITGRVWWYRSEKRTVETLEKRQNETTYVGHVPDMSKFKKAHRREPY